MKTIVLKKDKERAIINRHPWIFSGAIKKTDKNLIVGDMVVVKNHEGKNLALGHWCKEEGLVCRLFSFNPDLIVDKNFWLEKFIKAAHLRKSFLLPSDKTTGFRFFHGEGDGISGLVCDVFGECAHIQSSNPGLLPVIPLLEQFIVDTYEQKNIFFEDLFNKKQVWLRGRSIVAEFLEHGLVFEANLDGGQKTGHFFDQRDNRLWVKNCAAGRRVLDAFCYSGGFSLYALLGGAQSVTSVDISRAALLLCEKILLKNQREGRSSLIEADCFDYLRSIKRDEFDLIILDPPAFAKTAQTVPNAARGYKDINLLAFLAIAKQGLIFTFSCSQHVDMDLFKKIIFAAAKDSGRNVRIIKELSQGVDHPVSIYCPQSSYLKGLFLYIE